jgi:hypothetical protein
MTNEDRLKCLDDAITASGMDFAIGLPNLEVALRVLLPSVPISNGAREKRQRAYFIWNGSHVVCGKAVDLPPPTDAEVKEALTGLLDDVRQVLSQM